MISKFGISKLTISFKISVVRLSDEFPKMKDLYTTSFFEEKHESDQKDLQILF